MRKWLNELRKSKGLTMKAVSTQAEISESYYCQIENGSRGCPVETARKISAVLGFDWQKFFEDEKTPAEPRT